MSGLGELGSRPSAESKVHGAPGRDVLNKETKREDIGLSQVRHERSCSNPSIIGEGDSLTSRAPHTMMIVLAAVLQTTPRARHLPHQGVA